MDDTTATLALMSVRWSFGLVMLAVVAGLPRLAAAERLKVAVVPGIAVNLDTARVDTLSQELAEALRTVLDVDAIGGLEARRRLPVTGLPPDCVAIQACIDDVATRLEAQQLLFVVMVGTGTGGAIQVDTTWVDVAGKQTASRPAIDIATIATAKAQFGDAAQQLLPDAPVRPKPAGAGLGRMSDEIPRHLALPSYITAGVTVAGLGLGVSLGIVARNKYNDCETSAGRGAECSSTRKDAIRTTALLADAGWLIAIGGSIATGVLYATSGESSHLVVEPTPGGVAVTASGTF
jgi:hypothetical protein